MKKTKILSLALATTMTLLLMVGCGQKAAEPSAAAAKTVAEDTTKTVAEDTTKKVIKIGVTLESIQGFLVYVADGAKNYSKDHPEVQVTVQDAKLDVATQIKQVESFIAQKVDAIVIKCVDKDATQPISDACKAAGVKLIATNVKMNSPTDVYVGSDHKYSGTIEAEYIAEKLNGKGNVAILMGDPSHDAAQERTTGNKEVFAKFPGIKIVAEQTGMWNRDKGMAVAENWIQSGKQIDAIVANNDEMIIGAIRAYEQAGKTGVLFAGIDATKDALSYLKDKKMTVTVFQNGLQQGYGAVEAAHKLIMGETVPAYVDVPYELVPFEKFAEYDAKYTN